MHSWVTQPWPCCSLIFNHHEIGAQGTCEFHFASGRKGVRLSMNRDFGVGVVPTFRGHVVDDKLVCAYGMFRSTQLGGYSRVMIAVATMCSAREEVSSVEIFSVQPRLMKQRGAFRAAITEINKIIFLLF